MRFGVIVVIALVLVAGACSSSGAGDDSAEGDLSIEGPAETTVGSVTVTGRGPADELVRVTGGAYPITVPVDLDGTLEVEVPLQSGANELVFQVVGGTSESITVEYAPPPGDGVVAGTVMSEGDGAPVPGVTVSFGSSTTSTDARGRFSLRGLPEGPVHLRVAADGYLTSISEAVVVEGRGDAGSVLLTPLVGGVTIDEDGGEITGDGWRVVIPRGGVDRPTLIQATPLGFTGLKDTIGLPVLDLSPSGLEFAEAVRVYVDPTDLGLEPDDVELAGLDPDTMTLVEFEEQVEGSSVMIEVDRFEGLELRILPDGPWNKWGGRAALCTPFNQVQAAAADKFLEAALIPFLAVKISTTSAEFYARYLQPEVMTDRRYSVNDALEEFRDAPETRAGAFTVLRDIADAGLPVLRDPLSPARLEVTDAHPDAGFVDIDFAQVFTTPGNLAGGTGQANILGVDVPDSRQYTGTVTVIPTADERGVLEEVTMEADLFLEVFDAIDFCPAGYGNPGAGIEQYATIALSRLEVTPYNPPVGTALPGRTWATRFLFVAQTKLNTIAFDVTDRYQLNDLDADGWPDIEPWLDATVTLDNCFDLPNPDQADSDGDGLGDACDPEVGGTRAPVADCSAGEVAPNDDSFSPAIELPFEVNFDGQLFTTVWVNNNGNVTFDEGMSTYTPFDIATGGRPIIAPFFADVDTRGAGTVRYGPGELDGRDAFCVSWTGVGYFEEHTDKTNTFQLVLVDRSDDSPGAFDIIFSYDTIQWETGDASDGSEGFGGTPAAAGWSNGVDSSFQMPGSLQSGALVDGGPRALSGTATNSGVNGEHYWQIRS